MAVGDSYVWRSRRYLPERRGETCRLLVFWRRKCLVEFKDGTQTVTTLGCIRRVK